MARVTIARENQVGGQEDRFPRLKLKVGARARIWCPPEGGKHQPWCEWVHTIKAPQIKNGEAQKETRTRPDGTTYETYKTDFISQPICLGDLGILADKGVDEANCPVCEAAMQAGRNIFKPLVRYASPVIAYATKPGGWELAAPFSAQIFIWSYPGGRYGKLVDIAEAEARDLAEYDLRLGPCESPEEYQKYEIQAMGSRPPAWRTSPQVAEFVKELWTTPGNQPTEADLQAACGRAAKREFMISDIKRATQLWDMAEHVGAAASTETFGASFSQPASLTEGLAGLLDGGAPAAPAAAAPAAPAAAAPAVPAGDPFGAPAPAAAATPEQLAAVEAAKAQAQADLAGMGGLFDTPAAPAPNGAAAAAPATPAPAPNGAAAPAPAAPAPAAPAAEAPAAAAETVSFEDLLGG